MTYTEQPPPQATDGPHIHDLVAADIAARKVLGIERYGQPLQPSNGRDALRDLYEELLDGACYIRQVIAERDLRLSSAYRVEARQVSQTLIDYFSSPGTAVAESNRHKLLIHLLSEHGVLESEIPADTIQWHLNDHRLRQNDLDHGYHPWGEP